MRVLISDYSGHPFQVQLSRELARARYETDYAALSGARLVPVARTSHFIMLDRPELVREEIVRGPLD